MSVQPDPGSMNTYAVPSSMFRSKGWPGEPITTVSPDTDTDAPKWSSSTPSPALSLAVWLASSHPAAGLTKTYAFPTSVLPPNVASRAPATTVSPEMATELPSLSPAAPSEAVSSAVGLASSQPDAGLTNTSAAPCSSLVPALWSLLPTTMVSPEIATAPTTSAGCDSFSSAVWVALAQPEAGFSYTYATPRLAPGPLLCTGALTTSVSPDIATKAPNPSFPPLSVESSAACCTN